MKIALLGSAPSSVHKAPFGDPSWQIWACSPGAYPVLARVDRFFEVHRWEPGVVGKPQTQKPWFTPEYVQWLKTVPPVLVVADPDAHKECPNSIMLPFEELRQKYGDYVWTSSLAYMTAMAIDEIQKARAAGDNGQHSVGYYGVDMAANEELYSNQRSSCQLFIQFLVALDIEVIIPPESDLATPPPPYGVSETWHRAIKWLERKRELEARKAQCEHRVAMAQAELQSMIGALDDLQYHMTMWMVPGEDSERLKFEEIFPQFGRLKVAEQEIAALKTPAQAVASEANVAITAGSIAST